MKIQFTDKTLQLNFSWGKINEIIMSIPENGIRNQLVFLFLTKILSPIPTHQYSLLEQKNRKLQRKSYPNISGQYISHYVFIYCSETLYLGFWNLVTIFNCFQMICTGRDTCTSRKQFLAQVKAFSIYKLCIRH